MKYKSNQNICYSCKYYIIWCSKYRRKVLIDGVDARLKEIIQQTVKERSAELIELEIMSDHVHLLVEVDPQYGVHRLIKQIKGASSRKLRQEFAWLKSR